MPSYSSIITKVMNAIRVPGTVGRLACFIICVGLEPLEVCMSPLSSAAQQAKDGPGPSLAYLKYRYYFTSACSPGRKQEMPETEEF